MPKKNLLVVPPSVNLTAEDINYSQIAANIYE